MKKWLLHIIYIGMLLFLSVSCSNYIEEESLEPPQNDKVQVTFTLAMGEQTAAYSRASWEDNNGNGDAILGNYYENQIELRKLQVVAYAKDNAFIGKVKDIQYIRQSPENHIYKLLGTLDISSEYFENNKLSCKIMVFANCDEVNKRTDLASFSYDYRADDFKAGTQYIPMWGVKAYDSLELKPGTTNDLGTIYVLRAMAKVEVKLSEKSSTSGYNFSQVHINNYYKSGFCLPKGYEFLTDTRYLDTEGCYNPYKNEQTIMGGIDFLQETNSYVLYIPEYNNEDLVIPCIEVALTDSKGGTVELKESNIYFKNYTNGVAGESFNIIRNHYYVFEVSITEDPTGGGLKTDVETYVAEWNEVFLNPGYE